MDWIVGVDWGHVFGFDTPLLETMLRGSIVYLGLFALLRIVVKRESGALGVTDLLVVVLLADAAQNAMVDDYASVPDGLLLVGTIVFWSYALNWLGYRYPRAQRLIRPGPLPLVRDGRLLLGNLKQELLTEGELMSQLRLQGYDDLGLIAAAYMEGDGRISVIPRNQRGGNQGRPDRQLR
ncbi:MAG: hypothetical protein QOF01_5460 [Thermomicrobiales bacterium]|jgi:uncharacterized membrane protein YcaP (DUF421 family)|nr:hypothetical protein [Thermomicrobiales bacterium]MEA2598991.1 hypothetical protein [Thermomicrobiales bacterium]